VTHVRRLRHDVAILARSIKPWSRLTYWKVLASWSRFLIEFGHRDDDLMKGVPRPRTPDPIARPLTDETIAQLLQAKLSPRASAYVRLALFAGLRVHEIAKIRGEDFDWSSGWLLVVGKGGRTAPVPIHPELVRLGDHLPEFGFWFPSHSNPGRPVAPTSVTLTIGAALKSIGCNATAHQLRDSCGTRMQRQVKDIRLTQTMLRHRSLRSTQKYTEVANADMQAAVLSLDWARRSA
jgi:integrase/recombinase XerD